MPIDFTETDFSPGIDLTEDDFAPKEQEFSPTLSLSDLEPKASVLVHPPDQGFLTQPVGGQPPLIRTPETIPEGIYNVAAKSVPQLTTPLSAALGPISKIPGAMPVIAGVFGGLGAKQIGEAAGGQLAGPSALGFIPTPTPGLTPGQRAEGIGDIGVGALMALAPVAHVLSKTTSVLPRATRAAAEAIIENEVKNASEGSKTAEVHGDVRPQQEPTSVVPEPKGVEGVQPQAKEGVPQTGQEGVLLKEEQPELVGVGGALYEGEFKEPRQATAAGTAVEQAQPENKPIGMVSNIGLAINNAVQSLKTTLKGIAGESMPKTTAKNRDAGEAGVRYASSRIASKPLADTFAARVLQDTDVDPVKFGAALTEDNLRSIRESLKQQATKLQTEGKLEESEKVIKQADNVATIVGSKGSPFKTEDEYLDYLNEPSVKKAIGQHIQLWHEVIEPQYKEAMSIDPDMALPSRGLQTGARVNLKAVLPEESASKPVKGVGGASLTATFKKKSPFGVRAKGTGQTYDVDYQNIIRNTFDRQLEIANKNYFDRALVESGNAVIDSPGQQVTLPDGESTSAFPISRKVIVSKGKETTTFSQAKNIYVRRSLADEYRTAANVDPRHKVPLVSATMNLLNRAALAGLTDATVHLSNQATALFNRPVSGKLFADTLLSATGRADVPVTVVRSIIKAFQENKPQLSELAKIGALRPDDIHFGVFGKMLKATDRITRLMLDDTFKSLADSGLIDKSETVRREYVNQIGQYNRRLQGWFTRLARDTGFGPFVTAGKTFNALGVRMMTLDPGAPASGSLAAAALRINVFSKWIGAAVLVGTLNYLLTSKKGGGVLGRKGTPIGNVDLGTNDKSGKQQSLPVLSILGLGRGMRVTGVKGALDARRMGLTDADAMESASRDIINSWSAPFAGPPVKAATIAATGFPPAVDVGRASPVVPPGDNQRLENVKEAVREASPLFQTYLKYKQGKPLSEILSTQIPRLAPYAGKTEALAKDYPRIVKAAQANEFINWVVHETRRKPPEQRVSFATEQIKRLPPEFQKKAVEELKHRRVFSQ